MSNVIKAYTVRYEEEIKKTIDTHLRLDKALEEKRTKLLKPVLQAYNKPEAGSDGFVEGLTALVIDQPPSTEELSEQSSKVLEEAKAEAKSILEKAKKEAEQMKNEAYATAQKKGYDDGILQSKKELSKYKAEYDEKTKNLQLEYENMVRAFEPQMADVMATLIEKITGIMASEKQEVILYLIERAFQNFDRSEEYTIRVSREDYEFVSERKNHLLGAIGREVPLYIQEDASLQKNQCLIETEQKVINCSLDIQLNNLISDLKLISGI